MIRARASATARWLAGSVARWSGVLGLNYHRIGDGRSSVFDRGLWSATEEDFDRQVRFLKQHFDIISPRDIAYVVKLKRGRHVVITFDDGYADNYSAAFPILKSHGARATFFVATGFVDQPKLPWWDEIAWMVRTSKHSALDAPDFLDHPVPFGEPDREKAVRTVLKAYKRLPQDRTGPFLDGIATATSSGRAPTDVLDASKLWMTWDMLREMHTGGMTIGGHTVSHPILSNLTDVEQEREIAGCEQRIASEIGAAMRSFAYPVGARWAFNDQTRRCLKERGVVTAFSYYGGMSKLDAWDNYDIRRIAVEQETTFDEFRAMVMFPWTT